MNVAHHSIGFLNGTVSKWMVYVHRLELSTKWQVSNTRQILITETQISKQRSCKSLKLHF